MSYIITFKKHYKITVVCDWILNYNVRKQVTNIMSLKTLMVKQFHIVFSWKYAITFCHEKVPNNNYNFLFKINSSFKYLFELISY